MPDLFRQRPVINADLVTVRQTLDVKSRDMPYLLGISHVEYSRLARPAAADTPLKDPTLALLVWALLAYPTYRYLPIFPTPAEGFERFRPVAQHVVLPHSPERLAGKVRHLKTITLDTAYAYAYLLGHNHNSGSRWIKSGGKMTATTQRLLWLLSAVCEHEGAAGLQRWSQRVMNEARFRGIHDLWIHHTWTPPPGSTNVSLPEDFRPSLYMDIDRVRVRDALNRADLAYAFGMSSGQNPISVYLKTPGEPIASPTLALLSWALLAYPQYRYMPALTNPDEALPHFLTLAAALRDRPSPNRTPLPSTWSPEQLFRLMLGKRSSSIDQHSPTVRRLLYILSRALDADGTDGLQHWLDRVAVEARCRGLTAFWQTGHWRPVAATASADRKG